MPLWYLNNTLRLIDSGGEVDGGCVQQRVVLQIPHFERTVVAACCTTCAKCHIFVRKKEVCVMIVEMWLWQKEAGAHSQDSPQNTASVTVPRWPSRRVVTLEFTESITRTEGPMAVKSKEALDEGDKKVGGDESWAMTTNSTSFTDVRGRADGKLLLRMDAPPAGGIVVRVSNVL